MDTSSQHKQPARAHTPALDENGLAAFLATQPDVIAAYLFGSLAEGRATSHSDVDTAILFADASDPLAVGDRQLQLMDELERFTDREADVVILNTAPPSCKTRCSGAGDCSTNATGGRGWISRCGPAKYIRI
ncbi:MAG: nucleotidyltransferase domain-containing protein [Chloroflexota bacterium]|nr:nucleotidyltransferase domain-containing protein [Chloroflexota bacterium]